MCFSVKVFIMRMKNKEKNDQLEVDAVKRALENFGEISHTKIKREKLQDTLPKKRSIKERMVLVKKQTLEKNPRKSYFQDFSENDLFSKYDQKKLIESNNKGDEIKIISNYLKEILKNNELLIQTIFDMKKNIEQLETMNKQFQDQFMQMKAQFETRDHYYYDWEEEIVDEQGQKPVKWWVKE